MTTNTSNPRPDVSAIRAALTDLELRELEHMSKGHRMFYEKFYNLRDKGLCWYDYASDREILTPLGREVLVATASPNPAGAAGEE